MSAIGFRRGRLSEDQWLMLRGLVARNTEEGQKRLAEIEGRKHNPATLDKVRKLLADAAELELAVEEAWKERLA